MDPGGRSCRRSDWRCHRHDLQYSTRQWFLLGDAELEVVLDIWLPMRTRCSVRDLLLTLGRHYKMSGLVRLGAVLSAGAIVSLVLFFRTNPSRSGPLALWLGMGSLVLVATAVLCLAIAAAKLLEARQRSRPLEHIPADRDYVAEYSRGNRGLAIVLTGFCTGMFTVFILRQGHPPAIIISVLLLAGSIYYVIEVTG